MRTTKSSDGVFFCPKPFFVETLTKANARFVGPSLSKRLFFIHSQIDRRSKKGGGGGLFEKKQRGKKNKKDPSAQQKKEPY